jgi:hypothetical protein
LLNYRDFSLNAGQTQAGKGQNKTPATGVEFFKNRHMCDCTHASF